MKAGFYSAKTTADVRMCAPPDLDAHEGDILLSEIRPCPFNFRKHFPPEDLAALAESIKAIGLQERLKVRPIPVKGKEPEFVDGAWRNVDHFQLCDGERRYRALKQLKVERVPVVVRVMTDAEVRTVMITSREQSRDLLPSELAAGYAALIRDGKTLEQIGAEVGESVSHVRSVLSLAKLPAWALERVDAGELPRRTAELIARIPGERAREECAAIVLCDRSLYDHSGIFAAKDLGKYVAKNRAESPATYRDTEDLIRDEFQVELKGAPFDRKALDLVEGVGSCDECPKRAGNDAEAREAGTRADVCLDPHCFRAKTESHNKRLIADAKKAGRTVLPANQADTLFTPYGAHQLNHNSKYIDLAEKCYEDGGKGRSYKAILKGLDPEKVVLAIDQAGEPRELVEKETAKKLLKEAGIGSASASLSPAEKKWKAERAKERKEEEARKAAAVKACDIVAEKVGLAFAEGIPEETLERYLRSLVWALIESVWEDAARLVVNRRELGKGGVASDHLAAQAAKLDAPALFALAAELLTAKVAAHGFGDMTYAEKEEKEFWKAFGIDPKKLVKDAQAEREKPGKAAKPSLKSKLKISPAQKDNGKLSKSTEPAYACEAGKKRLGGGKLDKAKKKSVHKPGCSFEAALADATPNGELPNGLPAKLPKIAKPLREIKGFPEYLAILAEKDLCGTDITFSERVNRIQGDLNHEEKIRFVLKRVSGNFDPAMVDQGTEAFLNHLYPQRTRVATSRVAIDAQATGTRIMRMEMGGLKPATCSVDRCKRPAAIQVDTFVSPGMVTSTWYCEKHRGQAPVSKNGKPAPVGQCRVCGCCESDCTLCVERTGEPCHWVDDEKQDLCSACLPLLEQDFGVLFVGRKGRADQGLVNKLASAGVRTIGHILNLDATNPPKGITSQVATELTEDAQRWIDSQLAETREMLAEMPRPTKPAGDLKLIQVDGFPASVAHALEKRADSVKTLTDLERHVEKHLGGRTMASAVYHTIVTLVGFDGFLATMARDGVMKHLQPGWRPEDEREEKEQEPKPKKKETVSP